MESEPEAPKNVKYLLGYFYPPRSKNVHYIELHSKTAEEALVMARCMFGANNAAKHLFLKEVPVEE